MKNRARIFSLAFIVSAFLLLFYALLTPHVPGDTSSVASRVEKTVSKRIARMDALMRKAAEGNPSEWMHPGKLPDDMVIYRYVGDSLQSWCNTFPIINDDIGGEAAVERLVNPSVDLRSPLKDVTEKPSYINLGPKWYIAKLLTRGNVKVIAGFEIRGNQTGPVNDIYSPYAIVPPHYAVFPLTFSEGSTVYAEGEALFKIIYDSLSGSPRPDALLMWLALLLFVTGFILNVWTNRTLRSAVFSMAGMLAAMAAMYFWGKGSDPAYQMFSGQLYRGGEVLYSLGALITVNLGIFLFVLCLYLARGDVSRRIRSRKATVISLVLLTLIPLLVLAYAHLSFRSVLLNSRLTLEFYKLLFFQVNWQASVLVYLSFILLLVSVPMLIDLQQPALSRLFGRHFNVFSTPGRIVCALAIGAYLTVFAASLGFRMEEETVEGWALRGETRIPVRYSSATYEGYERRSASGSFAYPTVLSERDAELFYNNHSRHFKLDGYIHFVVRQRKEMTVFSRPVYKAYSYLLAAVLGALLALVPLYAFGMGRGRRRSLFSRQYYKRRITMVLILSLSISLAALTFISVAFVVGRNEDNMQRLMEDKASALQSMVQRTILGARTPEEVNVQQTIMALRRIRSSTGSSITLYYPDGRIMMSTSPELLDRMILSRRMDGKAYEHLMCDNRGYCIHRERLGSRKYYSLYIPLIGANDSIVAILYSPYRDESFNFEYDAVMHSLSVISVFLILLLVAQFMIKRIVDKMFRPLGELGRKMSVADIDKLELVEYDRQDEVSALVGAYNRMVTVLSESTRQLALAERDKAWSAMARQVAHEIKNPLTPMKLQIQRMIRLKQKGDPDWDTKFDESAGIILTHIDILSDTANEFSTFAKLYTEEPTQIKLDLLLQEEMSMFDNKPNIRFEYIGLEDISVTGPKPQLTRVFVNLINNAVQAVGDTPDSVIRVSLRNGSDPDCYEIVFEDNGPGVAPENVEKLFTPNFTTKSGGSGLGLAISRSILEKCGAGISYSRSFSLGGAAFTVFFPKICIFAQL